jgi:hypothetical protein
MRKSMGEVKKWTHEIRSFVVGELIEERAQNRSEDKKEDRNMMDCLLDQVEEDKMNPEVSRGLDRTKNISHTNNT